MIFQLLFHHACQEQDCLGDFFIDFAELFDSSLSFSNSESPLESEDLLDLGLFRIIFLVFCYLSEYFLLVSQLRIDLDVRLFFLLFGGFTLFAL